MSWVVTMCPFPVIAVSPLATPAVAAGTLLVRRAFGKELRHEALALAHALHLDGDDVDHLLDAGEPVVCSAPEALLRRAKCVQLDSQASKGTVVNGLRELATIGPERTRADGRR